MSITFHLLHSHLNRLPQTLSAAGDEQVERFHQDLKVVQAGRWDVSMMADYCLEYPRINFPSGRTISENF